MDPQVRRPVDVFVRSMETGREADRRPSPADSLSRRRYQELLARIGPAGRRVGLAGSDATARPLWRHDFISAPARVSAPPTLKRALLVDTDVARLAAVKAALQPVADVEVCRDFVDARARLLQEPPDLLITSLRLEAYNGVHLVMLAATTQARCIVFSTQDDIGLARDVQAAGAFFELHARLPQVLESYVNAALPQRDRRDVTKLGEPFRGGRRCTDH
jgi:ActR/RegA family two-component response regulator